MCKYFCKSHPLKTKLRQQLNIILFITKKTAPEPYSLSLNPVELFFELFEFITALTSKKFILYSY